MSTIAPSVRSRLASAQGDRGPSQQIVTFVLAGEEYGIDIMKVQEIILNGETTFIPRSPEFIRGLINLRGHVIPVVDLRKLFGMPTAEFTPDTRVLVIESHNQTVGLTVDAVNEVLRVSDKQLLPPPPTVASLGRRYLKGLVQLEQRLVILLEVDQLLQPGDVPQGADSAA